MADERPCNICGIPWPGHAQACSYAVTLRERDGARAEVEKLRVERDMERSEMYWALKCEDAVERADRAEGLARKLAEAGEALADLAGKYEDILGMRQAVARMREALAHYDEAQKENP
jgi:hypothetical protein